MDPEGEISQMEKDKYHMISLICGTTKTLKHKTKTKSQVQRTDWWLARGKWVGGGVKWGTEVQWVKGVNCMMKDGN